MRGISTNIHMSSQTHGDGMCHQLMLHTITILFGCCGANIDLTWLMGVLQRKIASHIAKT